MKKAFSYFKPENIFYLPAEDNWWGLEYGPCGPDSEMFYVKDIPACGPDCGPGCHCGKYTEIGNDVFMQYEKHQDGSLTPLSQKNVDTGWGLERILAFLNGLDDVYKIDLHAPAISYIEEASGIKYDSDEKLTRSMRILADHTRTSVMLIGDPAKLVPSNAGAGYVLRRLIRRAVRHARALNLKKENILKVANIYIDVYSQSYPLLIKNQEFILNELTKEIERFESTLENGMKEFKKILEESGASDKKEHAHYLFSSHRFLLYPKIPRRVYDEPRRHGSYHDHDGSDSRAEHRSREGIASDYDECQGAAYYHSPVECESLRWGVIDINVIPAL